MRGVVAYTDFLVIATGNTGRQTQAIEDAVYQDKKHGEDGQRVPQRVEGRPGRWILMDYLDVVVHVFTPAARATTASRRSGTRCAALRGQAGDAEFSAVGVASA